MSGGLEYAERRATVTDRGGRAPYLRFGGLPAGGRSTKLWGSIGLEGGVSVFEARETAEGYEVRLGHPFQINDLARVLKEGRELYRVEGREVGRGLSDEPLLADARIAGRVGAGSRITVSGGGFCSVYLRALLERWSGGRAEEAEHDERMGGRC